MTTDIIRALRYNAAAEDVIFSVLNNTPFSRSRRLDLVHAYIAIVIEHMQSIALLVDKGLNGSAFALWRPQVETMARALWVNRVASDEQVEAIRRGKEPFGTFRSMVQAIDAAYKHPRSFSITYDLWPSLNGFAHSGAEQLACRFDDQSKFVSSYPEGGILALVYSSSVIPLMILPPLLVDMGFPEKSKVLQEWYGANSIPTIPPSPKNS